MSTSTNPLPGSRRGAGTSAIWNALVIAVTLGLGAWALVERGQLAWPPTQLLAGLTTLAGCLALAGPVVLARHDPGQSGVGDLMWLTAGVLSWLYNLASIARGSFDPARFTNPLGTVALGLAVLASLLAGWRLYGLGRNWTWTNVVGWVLGLFWLANGLIALLPGGQPGWLR